MQISKWGDSLVVRLPAEVVEALELKEGDEVEVEADDGRKVLIARDRRREEAMARIRALKWNAPPGYKFSRDEANERG